MDKFMSGIFGASWRTSVMGILGGVLIYFTQVGVAFPSNAEEWKASLIAAFIFAWGQMQKDKNVTNSPQPVSPVTVPPELAKEPNPAARP